MFGVSPDAVVFNSLINSCAKASSPTKAEKWLLKMGEAGFRPDEKTYNCVISACAKLGLVERA
eukprot:6204636-Pyramimonas_sp.AAC.1